MEERNQIISFLLQVCDQKSETIKGLQRQVADLQQKLEPKAAHE